MEKDSQMNDDKTFCSYRSTVRRGLVKDARVLIAGCGSGGSQVALQLVMSGISKFALFDSDTLDPENVHSHAWGAICRPAKGRRTRGRFGSTENPAVEIERYNGDLMSENDLPKHIARSSVVVLATDNDPTGTG